MSGRAILLVNLGSPASTATPDVRRYLDEFLMDPYVLDVPHPVRALIVRGFILPSRPAKSGEAYAKIWTEDGSPLIVISHRTRAALEAHTGVPVGLAMRYGSPSIAGGIDALLERAGTVDDLTVVAMYPQYAMASTMTVEVAVEKELRARGVPHRFIPPFFADDGYLDALAALAREHLPGDVQQVLFSYHGIPKRHLRKVDPTRGHCLGSPDCCETPSPAHATCYRHQVFATTHGVAQRLGLSRDQYAVSFQSRLGGGWLQPFTDVVLAELPARGVERIAVVCPSFVADCLETLEEISIRGRASFLAAGGKAFAYLPCLNDDPRWIAALAKLCDAPSAVQR
ncbi:MAG TPA: ferrochelatase [Candidatus Baltobacteraceae bacterium]|nr:ferrochelatase [Candidatus Baltobacteraceae bacterium]